MRTEGQSGEIALPQPLPHTFFFFKWNKFLYCKFSCSYCIVFSLFWKNSKEQLVVQESLQLFTEGRMIYLDWETFSCSKPCV